METRYPHLFSPIRIGNLTFRNRVFNSPTTQHALLMDEPYPTEATIRHYANKAKGGAGLVTLGNLHINERRFIDSQHVRWIYGPEVLNDYSVRGFLRLTEAIHFYGARASLELSYGGHIQANRESVKRWPAYGPSAFTRPDGVEVQQMPPEEMERLASNYAACARFAKRAGFDMVTLHFGHGTGMAQFLSPKTNTRTDAFGGSLENRAKFPLMVLDAVREAVGDMAIEVRVSGSERTEGGIELEECIAFVKQIEDRIDLIHVSAGTIADPHTRAIMHPSGFLPPACNAYLARAVRQAGVKIPVAAVGAIHDAEVAEALIAGGSCDVVTGARAQIADPDYPNKARAGRTEEIVPCIKCFHCLDYWKDPDHMYLMCSVNPCFGREHTLPGLIRPVERVKRVAVVGGGPAGMEAAITAAGRGHRVTLFEKTGQLGGLLNIAEYADFKYDLAKYKRYLCTAVARSGAEVRLNTEATPELLATEGFDAVIAALGSEPLVPPIPGAEGEQVRAAAAVYGHTAELSRRVAVIGGGQVGCETALYLAQEGHQVTLVEMGEKMAADAVYTHRIPLMERLEASVELLTGAVCTGIDPEGVTVQRGAEQLFLPAGSVVLAVGMRSCGGGAELIARACEGAAVGDCVRPRSVGFAVREAYDAAMNL